MRKLTSEENMSLSSSFNLDFFKGLFRDTPFARRRDFDSAAFVNELIEHLLSKKREAIDALSPAILKTALRHYGRRQEICCPSPSAETAETNILQRFLSNPSPTIIGVSLV